MNRRFIKQSDLKRFSLLLVASVAFSIVPLLSNNRSFIFAESITQIESSDGKQKSYYAVGDEFLVIGLKLTEHYWREIETSGKHLLRGHLDNYLPIALKELEYEPADVMMRSFADSFFAARDRKTGLIPYSYDSWLDQSKTMRTKGKQPVGLISQAVKLCQWFPGDVMLQDNCLALAEDTIEHFDVISGKNNGIWGWVDVKTGAEPKIPLTLTHDYGAIANALAYLSQTSENPKLMQWADQKLEFVWENRLNSNLPVLHEQFIPTKALSRSQEMSSDTDTLYYVRQLFELYELTGDSKYRDWAISVTDLWYENAWNAEWGHFIRKLNPDGSQAVDTLYGDGKYNTLYILIHAYEVTQNPQYLNRFKQAWDNLLTIGDCGFVAESIKQGQMVEAKGLDKQQTFFLDLLVAAYEASGDSKLLQAAEDFGRRIVTKGEQVMRIESGQAGEAFLRLALARQKIHRLELELGEVGQSIVIRDRRGTVLETKVPTEVAVVYLPEENYEVAIVQDGLIKEKIIRLNHNQIMKLNY